jgi:hypothetical protein
MSIYFLHTFHKLPPSKHIVRDLSEIRSIVRRILRRKPTEKDFDWKRDLPDSLLVTKIDPIQFPEWESIFVEKKEFSWRDLDIKYERPSTSKALEDE